ncbi:TPA: hypothetical protein ACK1V7_001849 [Enterobacter cloacae]
MSTISREKLIEDLKASAQNSSGMFEIGEETICALMSLLTAPPAPPKSEPIAWLWSHRKHPSEVTLVHPEDDEKAEAAHWSGWSCQALCAESLTGNSHYGWMAVPVEPTLEMIKAGAEAASTGMLIPGMYRAMLAAASQQEVKTCT